MKNYLILKLYFTKAYNVLNFFFTISLQCKFQDKLNLFLNGVITIPLTKDIEGDMRNKEEKT